MKATEILFSRVLDWSRDLLSLTLQNEGADLDRPVRRSDIARPGLRLTGFDAGFSGDEIQVLGEEEILYLESLSSEDQLRSFGAVLGEAVPCVVVADSCRLPDRLIEAASSSRSK